MARYMSEDLRQELLRFAAEGKLRAAYRGHNYIYSHAGVKDGNIENLNSSLKEIGHKLLNTYEESNEAYKDMQKEVLTVIEKDHGSEISSVYPNLFDMNSDSEGRLSTGGIIWRRFYNLDTNLSQVVGYTRGKFMKSKEYSLNPQQRREALNANTIRDYHEGLSPVTVTVEDEESLEIFKFSNL